MTKDQEEPVDLAALESKLTAEIDKLYAEVNRLNAKYGYRITGGQLRNIHSMKDRAKKLIQQRNDLRNNF